MERFRGRPKRGAAYREVWRVSYKTEVKEIIEERERKARGKK